MTGFSIALIGKAALLKKLEKRNFTKPVAGSIRKMTMWFEATTKASTPVDTGRLRASVASKVEPKGGAVFTNVTYAPFVEYGTRKMEARHVQRGSSARILGMGMFTYALEQLNQKMSQFMGELARGIKVRFD